MRKEFKEKEKALIEEKEERQTQIEILELSVAELRSQLKDNEQHITVKGSFSLYIFFFEKTHFRLCRRRKKIFSAS